MTIVSMQQTLPPSKPFKVVEKGKRYYIILALLLGIPAQKALAQLGGVPLLQPGMSVSVDYLPASHYIRPEDSLKTGATTSQKRYNFATSFLLHSRVDTATGKARLWGLGTTASYTQLTNKDYEKTLFPKELLATDITLQHFRTINKKWSLMAMLMVGLYTDMEKIDQNDVFINGGVVFIKQHNRKFAYGFGAVLTNSFGTPMVLPALMLRWKTGERYKIDVNFPQSISVTSSLSKYTDLALALRLRGGAYDVEQHPGNKRVMGTADISIGLENTWHLSRKIDFVAAGGSILLNKMEFQEKSLSEMFKTRPEHRLGANYFLSAGLRWNFQAKK
ncbi:DUF6268 family outer membrane beta-barrel protein [Chitinophaga nivalis]|uniref:DUF6268 family outer membrane beta-barrel protein n=1 Tax=Chitinophaga nivalis TaxID=2991709 RepID=A0ABT3ILX2_9BACT|nr:DUF6268 family outer membrane beta-barrel protein [Chitinophaga nivalis]MCW3465342.1 DUF6268 family outer membrane beta-barrel protein [Chitinophaga nivalis]MCW3484966.1 DUF6268 family outer membrane beta-barrel protein [Chitinophaga nivalis]